jgi:hypothetical protein
MGLRPTEGDEERMQNGECAAKFDRFFRGAVMPSFHTDSDALGSSAHSCPMENRLSGPRTSRNYPEAAAA